MDKLKLKLGEKRTLELTSGTTVVVKMDGGDCDTGEPMYDVKLLGCSWAEIVAIGYALAPAGLSAAESAQAVRDVEVQDE